jgi:FdhD protein
MITGAARLDETPWILEVNDRLWAHGTGTRGHAEALGAGRLLASGTVVERTDLVDIVATSLAPGQTLIRARVDPARVWLAEQERRHAAERGCGLLHVVMCDATAVRHDRVLAVPPNDRFPPLFRALFAAASARHPDGGVHAAALTDGKRLVSQIEDVGRHNAVDKIIGAAFLDDLDLRALGLILSARVSAQIALSAARAGVAWIASRSVPTNLAVSIAAAARLPIVERAASPAAGTVSSSGEA